MLPFLGQLRRKVDSKPVYTDSTTNIKYSRFFVDYIICVRSAYLVYNIEFGKWKVHAQPLHMLIERESLDQTTW